MNPTDARAPAEKRYSLEVVENEAFERTFSSEESPNYSPVSLIVKLTYNGTFITTYLTVQAAKTGSKAYVSKDQVKNFSDSSITNAVCTVCPDLWEKIKRSGPTPIALPFTEQSLEVIYVPLNREVAANMILAFFNSTLDPLDKIREVISQEREGARARMGRILTTYYLCCIKYLTNIDMASILQEDDRCRIMIDDLQAIPNKARPIYMNLKSDRREIKKEIVAFHAIYGAYVMCRPVATKRSFRDWVSKRYSSFLSSVQYTPEANVSLPIQEGGTHVNEVVVERSFLRKVVYNITKMETDDIVLSAIKTHVRFLTSLSDMTTYSLINQVINQGGAIVCISPLAGQIAKYVREREEVYAVMARDEIPKEDIVYLHLVKPNYQCFRSADYPDLIRTAQIMDKLENPGNQTLENYKAKIQGATCDEGQIRQFLKIQRHAKGYTIDEKEKAQISVLLGDAAESIYEEARRIVNIIRKRQTSDD